MEQNPDAITRDELREWLATYLAQLLGMEAAEVDPDFSFELYGLDSTAAVGLSGDLSALLGREFDTVLAYDYPNINALLDQLTAIGAIEA
ncbi:MAG: acyl carrier protein [Planctomycetota bacterium]|jgi:acyl carrier protein